MRWWTRTCSIHCGQSITEQHSPSELAVLFSLKEAAASARGTTRWKEILLVKEDPNVTVSKEQRREMRLVVEVSFQHGSQEGGKKKPETSAEGTRCRQLPSEGRKREDRAVWSLCRLGAALISPRRRRHLAFQEEGMWSFLWGSCLSETRCTSSAQGCQITPPKILNGKSRNFSPLFQLIWVYWVKTNYKLALRGWRNIWPSGIKWPSSKQVD